MHKVYLALGTNLGDREKNLQRALGLLECEGLRPVAVAAPVETVPEGFESRNLFLNTAGEFATTLSPGATLLATQRVELAMGRTLKSAGGLYHDRVIDIDILFYDSLVVNSPRLTVPHPLVGRRLFVLRPLMEIAPAMRHPVSGKTVSELFHEASRPAPQQ